MESATRRAHLVGTTSGSDSTSHTILSSWLIVVGFSLQSFYVRISMVRFTYLRKHLGTIPLSFFLTDIAASAWDIPRRGHRRQPTIRQIWRYAQAVPNTLFGDWRRPLLHATANENRSHEPTPRPTPWQRNIDLKNLEEHITEPRKTPLL